MQLILFLRFPLVLALAPTQLMKRNHKCTSGQTAQASGILGPASVQKWLLGLVYFILILTNHIGHSSRPTLFWLSNKYWFVLLIISAFIYLNSPAYP
jgi:hypothetical protein